MKKLILLFFVFPALCSGQIVFDFDKRDLSGWVQCRESSWDTAAWPAIPGQACLSHVFDNQDSGHDQISTSMDSLRTDLGITTWEFTVHHSYNPSSSNNWAFFLISDQGACEMHPAGSASGYALGVNYHGSNDLLKLWRIDRGKGTTLIETSLNWQEIIGPGSPCRLKAIRDIQGAWIIYYKLLSPVEDWIETGRGLETRHIAPAHIGLYYEYSSRQDMKLRVDDIKLDGFFLQDTIPPAVDTIKIRGSSKLFIRFSEKIDTSGLINTLNFQADHDLGHPINVHFLTNNELLLTFGTPFPDNQECTLLIHNISDLKGNMLSISRHYFTFRQPKGSDIIINEIMPDPSPSMGLPEFEYIELFNRTCHHVSLNEWQLVCNQTTIIFPDTTINSGDYLLLTHDDAQYLFADTIKIAPLLRSKTTVKNDAGTIMVYDPDGHLIDWLYYDEDWHENDYFRSGGWSLERIDPDRFCGGNLNWKTSKDPDGGTPGEINSINQPNPDTLDPEILRVELPEKDVVKILFSEPMDSVGQVNINHYDISGFQGMISHIALISPEYNETRLHLNQELNRDSVFYLEISPQIKDCSGNALKSRQIRFAVPNFPDSRDVVINEILFNPLPGGSDFVELYNASSNTYDLNDLLIANRDLYTDSISSVTKLDQGHRLFFPHDYLLLSENIGQIMIDFPEVPSGDCIELPDLPSYGDKSGTVMLLNRWYQVIDEFAYNSSMHFPLLASEEGVSLERISPHYPTNDPNNWHSAAEDAGFATPGSHNSQGMSEPSISSGITIEPEVFSPDNDGIDDFIRIQYRFDFPGSVISAWIFDPRGRLICQLSNNRLLGNNGHVTWDGTDHSGRRVNTGIYIVYIKLFTLNGQVWEVKKACVLSGRNL